MPVENNPIDPEDRQAIDTALRALWGDTRIIAHKETYQTEDLPGLCAKAGSELLGFLHYHLAGNACEIITLASL